MKNKIFIRVLAIVALVAFLGVSVFAAISGNAASVDQAKRQQQEALEKKKQAEKSQEEQIARREELDVQIMGVQEEIDKYQKEIDNKVVAIDATQKKIDELTVELQEQNASYAARAEALIKKGGVTYTEILLKSKSIDDMVTRMSIIKHIVRYDSQKLDEIEKSMVEVDELKNELVDQKAEVVELKEEQDAKKAELDTLRAESQQIIDDLQADIEAFEREYELAKQAEANAKAHAEQLRQQYDSSSSGVTLPSNYTAGQFVWPSDTTRLVTSPYGYRIHPVMGTSRFHAGIDIGAAYGTNILASDAGVVLVSGYNSGGYGNYVVINHGGGYTTLYAHCSSLLVSSGQAVARGQVIAKCGSTGMSTGPHIHYEVQYNGKTTNPMQYFN
ncbi:MAG: peptidoglycan DD-metalloendopeptidase family protein [Clostridia bacterium]|nr:peptidoglycan DD-metalloendopeptidase family protein [Clostridia bacterium]